MRRDISRYGSWASSRVRRKTRRALYRDDRQWAKETEMNEKDLQLAKAMVDAKLGENAPKKNAVSRMHDKQQIFR